MAIKAGQIIHDANGFVVDRIQTGGVSNLNIPEEKIYELGNYDSVATVRDTADLSFDLESFDVSTEMEALLTGQNPTTVTDGQAFSFDDSMPIDIVSPFKATGAYNIVKGLVIPYLTLESSSYRFGVRQNSTQSFTLRGDSIFYVPGTPKYEAITLVDNTLTYNYAQTALKYVEAGDDYYVLSACVKNPATGAYKRLFLGDNYTNTTTAITLLEDWFDAGYTKLHICYATASANTYPTAVHQGTTVKPAAVRGKDIDVYISDERLATPILTRWTGVQNIEVTRSVALEADEELGNYKYVAQDYDTADVTGSITVKPTDLDDLYNKIYQIANVADDTEIVGPYSSVPLEIEMRIHDPETGARLKTLYVSDARFTLPGGNGQVQTKLQKTFNFTSDGGNLQVFNGER